MHIYVITRLEVFVFCKKRNAHQVEQCNFFINSDEYCALLWCMRKTKDYGIPAFRNIEVCAFCYMHLALFSLTVK